MSTPSRQTRPLDPKRNRQVAVAAAGVAFAMVGLAYASVPLYRLFCQVTGFGGTTQRAEVAPGAAGNRMLTIRFDANTAASLPWSFHPEQLEMNVKLGEQNLAFYRAANRSDKEATGSAIFNVTPAEAGAYFNKIQCFCFSEQRLRAGETVDMPVVFFVDPKIEKDPDLRTLTTITLSYTFYPAEEGANLTSAEPETDSVTR
ncbi:MAG: cytochrome c oxidase assembly protein [Hyphomicrobiales bacterium]